MTEQTTAGGQEKPATATQGTAPTAHHEHVRTDGETSVDDAIGTSDDPA